jgi:glycosyltransferase involved in cell wall biosynthesis
MKPERVFVVRNGPDLNKVHPVAPDERLKSLNKRIIGYVGMMNPQDGVDYLLRSLSHLVYELGRNDFYCVIIGKGESLEYLKSLAFELEIEDYVWFTGFIPNKDKLRYLSTAEICVDPDPSSPLNDVSTWIKIMEYMALGKPIVTFDLKETRYTAQDAAVYVPPNDVRIFAEEIAKLMDSPAERKRIGDFGYKRVSNGLAWQHVSRNLILAYESLRLARN